MGKKKEKTNGDSTNLGSSLAPELDVQMQLAEDQDDTPNKKNKKHKRKRTSKEKKHQENSTGGSKPLEQVDALVLEDDDQEILIDDVDMDVEDSLSDSASGAKLLIKTPDTPVEKNMKLLQKSKSEKSKSSSGSKKSVKKRDGSKGEDDTDSEEERWLDAIESGKLEEVDDELKRIKNPRLMTARQRALMEKRCDVIEESGYPAIPAEPLLALPTGFKEKVLTEEMIAKKAIKSKRRREQAIEKREEDKKKTVDRLLKKQDSKGAKGGARAKGPKTAVPTMSYLDNRDGIFLSFPLGGEATPIATLTERNPPKPVVCGVEACFNLKKYSCSKTGVPLCSLECYKRNLILQKVTGSVT